MSLYDKTERFGFSQIEQRILLQSFHKRLGLVLAQPWLLACKDLVLVEFVPRFNFFFVDGCGPTHLVVLLGFSFSRRSSVHFFPVY